MHLFIFLPREQIRPSFWMLTSFQSCFHVFIFEDKILFFMPLGMFVLGWSPEGNVYFQYGVAIPTDGTTYTASASANIDGTTTGFQSWGYVKITGKPVLVLHTACLATGVWDATAPTAARAPGAAAARTPAIVIPCRHDDSLAENNANGWSPQMFSAAATVTESNMAKARSTRSM